MDNVHHLKAKKGSGKIPTDAVEFLMDADRIQERPLPLVARSVLYVIVFLVVALVVWASLSTIDSYVTARGKIITEGSNVVLQPLETSIVRSMNVRKGQVVKKGDTLVEFDATFSRSDEIRLLMEFDVLSTRLQRLRAESNGTEYNPENPTDVQKLEIELAARNLHQRESKRGELESQRRIHKLTVKRLESDVTRLSKQLVVLKELEKMKKRLIKKGAGSKASYLKEHLKTLDIEKQRGSAQRQILEVKQQIIQTNRAVESFDAEWKRKTLQRLIEVKAQRASASEQLKKAKRRNAQSSIVAPFDGFVLDVAKRDSGSVINAAEAVVTLVPTAEKLLAEIWIPARDIGKVAIGDSVRVKVESFPFQRHGIVEGKVESLSGDSFVGPEGAGGSKSVAPGEVYYLARVRIPPIREALRNIPKNFHTLPGMTLNAEVQVGKRRVVSYFLYPIFRMLDESIRET